MKRSRHIALVLMSVSPLLLSACGSKQTTEEGLYTSVEACVSQTNDQQNCQQAFAQAQHEHTNAAPHYGSKAACEAEHGEGQCQLQRNSSSIFLPIMAGYMMGRMMEGNRVTGLQSAPAFRDNNGNWLRPAPSGSTGTYRTGSLGGRPTVPVQMAANQAPTVQRGGFGGNSGRRSFGG